jgi:hypothetical protein
LSNRLERPNEERSGGSGVTIKLILKNAGRYEDAFSDYERNAQRKARQVEGTTLKLLPGNRSALSDSDSNQFYRRKRLLLEFIPGQVS